MGMYIKKTSLRIGSTERFFLESMQGKERDMILSKFLKSWKKDTINLDATNYVIDVEKIKKIIEQAKHKQVLITQADVGNADMTDTMMHI